MNRLRWMDVKDLSNEEFGNVREAISKRQLRPNSTSGFKITSSNAKQIVGRFVKRFEYVEKIQDPFGKTIELPIFGYDEVEFSIYNSSPHIEMLDAPAQSANLLISEIQSILPSGRIISDVDVEPMKWLKSLSKRLETVMVNAINLVDIPVTNSISAKVSLEGVEDVREAIAKMTGSRNYTVHKLRLEARFQGDLTKIDLIADARANTSMHLERMRSIFREALIETRIPSRRMPQK